MTEHESRKPKRDFAAYGRVIRKTWRSVKFRKLDDLSKLVLLYLWTCQPGESSSSIFYIGFGTIADDLGKPLEMVTECLSALEADGWFRYDHEARVVFLPRQLGYDPPTNPNQLMSFITRTRELPDTPLVAEYYQQLEPYVERFGEALPKALQEAFTKGLRQPFRNPVPVPVYNIAQAQELVTQPEPEQPGVDEVAKAKAYKKAINDAVSHWMINKMPSQRADIGGIPGKIYDLWLPHHPSPNEMTEILKTFYYNSTSPRMVLADMTKRGDYKGEQISKVRRDAASRVERSISY